jgi:hypothetical protein
LSPTWTPIPPRLQIDVQDVYEIGFEHSTYARKEKDINFPLALVIGPTTMGSSRIAETNSISRVQPIQELSTLKLMLRSHAISNWGVLALLGKVRRYPF